jgi:two-component system LytT family response regulator
MSITTLLVDDEPLAIAEFQQMLTAFPDVEILGTAVDAASARKMIEDLQPKLLFLDINMPGKSGFDLLEELDYVPAVIFVTAYDEYAIRAFEVNALDYLLKPVNSVRLKDAVEKIRRSITSDQPQEKKLGLDKKVFIKDGEQCFFVPIKDVYLIESVGNYVKVYYKDQKPMLHKSLNYLEEKLPEEHFFRASRQHMININFIDKIHPYFNSTLQIVLANGMKIDVSQRQSVRFRERMGI